LEHITLSSTDSEARVNLLGAELSSYTFKNKEYIWQANPAVWGRHAPILFPIVGKLRDNSYIFEGKTYTLGQHGFARDREFVIVDQSDTHVTLLLRSDESSKAVYPFDFELEVTYSMQSGGILVDYLVRNSQPVSPIWFSIGAHPGFIIPLDASERLEDYELNFYDATLQRLELYPLVGGYVSKEKESLSISNGILGLRKELFENDALIMDVHASAEISIRSKKSGKGVGMSYSDFKWLGIWTKAAGAGFICIEPWNGIADTVDHDQQLETKWGITSLDAGESYSVTYEVNFY